MDLVVIVPVIAGLACLALAVIVLAYVAWCARDGHLPVPRRWMARLDEAVDRVRRHSLS